MKFNKKHSNIKKRLQEIIVNIELSIKNFSSPSVCIQNNPTLNLYFRMIKGIEFKISQLKGLTSELIKNPHSLIEFIDNNLTVQLFMNLNLPFRIPNIQQLPPIPTTGNGKILDLNEEAVWNTSTCFTLKQLTSNTQIYDGINTDFENKRNVFIDRLKQFTALVADHINEYGIVITYPNEKKKKWYQKWWTIFLGIAAICGFIWFMFGKTFPDIWRLITGKKPPAVLTEEDIRKIGDEIEQRYDFRLYYNESIYAKDTLKISFEKGLFAMDNYKWNEAIKFFKTALTEAHDNQFGIIYNNIGICY